MQEGIKIKSKDINFVISTFYLAINSFTYIFIIHIKIISLSSSLLVFCLLLKMKELAVSHGKLMTN